MASLGEQARTRKKVQKKHRHYDAPPNPKPNLRSSTRGVGFSSAARGHLRASPGAGVGFSLAARGQRRDLDVSWPHTKILKIDHNNRVHSYYQNSMLIL